MNTQNDIPVIVAPPEGSYLGAEAYNRELHRQDRLRNAASVFNVKKSKIDVRDWPLSKLGVTTAAPIPATSDLRSAMPAVVDQGNLGSCTANAIAAAFQYDQIKQKIAAFPASRLFVYYNERLLEGTVNYDSGAYIRDGIKTLNTYGVCAETAWPYVVSQYRTKPNTAAYTAAKLHTALSYYAVPVTTADIKSAVAAGFPVTIGFTVYSSFMSAATANTGVMTLPTKYEQVLGGHAVLIVGYDDVKQRFIVRNSWGTNWGDKGYFYMPYAYVTTARLNDLWVVSSVK